MENILPAMTQSESTEQVVNLESNHCIGLINKFLNLKYTRFTRRYSFATRIDKFAP